MASARSRRTRVPLDVSNRFRQGKRMPATTREDWERLASYVISARIDAGYKDRRSFAAATGITERTLGTLETGHRVSPDTLAVVERYVGWRPDSARQVLRGGEPSHVTADGDPWPTLTPRQKERARAYIEGLLHGSAESERRDEPGSS